MILGCVAAMASGCSSGVFEVEVASLRAHTVPRFFDGTATSIETGRETWLVAEADHVIAEVKVKVGDRIPPGTLLVVFRPSESGVTPKKTAVVKRLEDRMRVLAKGLERNQKKSAALVSRRAALNGRATAPKGGVSRAARLDRKRLASLDQQIAKLMKAAAGMEASLAALQNQLTPLKPQPISTELTRDLAVWAPFEGVVADLPIEAGQRVSTGDRLVLLRDDRTLALTFVVDAGVVTVGQPAQVALDEEQMLSGTVVAVEPESPRQLARVVVHSPGRESIPTVAGRFRFVRSLEALVYQVPVTAVGTSDGAPCVFVVADHRARAVAVTIMGTKPDTLTVHDPSGALFDGQPFVAALVDGNDRRSVTGLSDKNPVQPIAPQRVQSSPARE